MTFCLVVAMMFAVPFRLLLCVTLEAAGLAVKPHSRTCRGMSARSKTRSPTSGSRNAFATCLQQVLLAGAGCA